MATIRQYLHPDVETQVRAVAAALGVTVYTYIADAVEQRLAREAVGR